MLNLFATGGARIEGQVSADGDPSTSNANYGGGGGSGGTIRIKTAHLDGSGNVTVDGGNGECVFHDLPPCLMFLLRVCRS